jgi:hypothetical protein
MLKYGGGDADATRLCQWLKASCYVDSVAVDIVDSGDDVTDINADAQFNAMRVQDIGIPLSHRLLQRDGASHRLNRTREFHQNAVAFDPDNPPGMSLDAWPNHVLQYTLQTAPRSDLVLTSKPAIADHVGKQDCCQATLHSLLRHRVPSRSIRPALAWDTIAKTNGASLQLNSLVAEKQITPDGAHVFLRLLGIGAQGAGGSHRNSKALASPEAQR